MSMAAGEFSLLQFHWNSWADRAGHRAIDRAGHRATDTAGLLIQLGTGLLKLLGGPKAASYSSPAALLTDR